MAGVLCKPIKGFEEYIVTSSGLVWSLKGGKAHLLKPSKGSGRYFQLTLSKVVEGKRVRKTFRIHRLVAVSFIPNPEGKSQVDHKNGDSFDNRVENLRWVTAKENRNNPVTAAHTAVSMHQYWEANRKGPKRRWKKLYPGEVILDDDTYMLISDDDKDLLN